MTLPANGCPDDNAWLELVDAGALPPGAELQRHLDRCDDCRRLLAELTRGAVPPDDLAVMRTVPLATQRLAGAPGPAPATSTVEGLVPGLVVGERYRLVRPLGEGGLGVVWAALHLGMQRSVALKFLKSREPDHVRRFLREARVTATIRHPHVVEVHDVFEPPGLPPVLVMDLLEGETLRAVLARQKKLSLADTAFAVLPILSAAGAAHALGIVHRDLKPENVLVSRGVVKVLDFGIAKVVEGAMTPGSLTALTESGFVLGTPHYMAPEQLFADKVIDHRADVWAIGVVLYECLAGRRPIDGSSLGQIIQTIATRAIVPLRERAPEIPAPVAALVDAMLAVERDARPTLAHAYEVLLRG